MSLQSNSKYFIAIQLFRRISYADSSSVLVFNQTEAKTKSDTCINKKRQKTSVPSDIRSTTEQIKSTTIVVPDRENTKCIFETDKAKKRDEKCSPMSLLTLFLFMYMSNDSRMFNHLIRFRLD